MLRHTMRMFSERIHAEHDEGNPSRPALRSGVQFAAESSGNEHDTGQAIGAVTEVFREGMGGEHDTKGKAADYFAQGAAKLGHYKKFNWLSS